MTSLVNDKQVFAALKQAGLTRAQSIALLPDWWEPAIAKTPGGLAEMILLLSRRLSLDAGALALGIIERIGAVSELRFKHTARLEPESLQAATLIASSLARAVVGALPISPPPPPLTAGQVRDHLLRQPGGRVDFDSLLGFCWELGIPVVPLPNLPRGVKKMDAAALRVGKRPVIIVTRKSDSKAWLSFLLAHELGHIALGHVPENGTIIEGSLKDTVEFDAQGELDVQENEANAFAHELLGGPQAEDVVSSWPPTAYPIDLAARASQAAGPLRSAPGQLLLRYAFLSHRWPEAQTALKFLHDDVDAQVTLITHLRAKLQLSTIADDLQEFVAQITGIESSETH